MRTRTFAIVAGSSLGFIGLVTATLSAAKAFEAAATKLVEGDLTLGVGDMRLGRIGLTPRLMTTINTERHTVDLAYIGGNWVAVSCKDVNSNTLTLSDTQRSTPVTSRKQLASLMPAYSELV